MSPGTARRLLYSCCRFLTLYIMSISFKDLYCRYPDQVHGVHNRNCYILRGWIMHNSKISPNYVFNSCPFKALIFVSLDCFYTLFYPFMLRMLFPSLLASKRFSIQISLSISTLGILYSAERSLYSPSPCKNSDFLTFAR
jgi:hypothetical protein